MSVSEELIRQEGDWKAIKAMQNGKTSYFVFSCKNKYTEIEAIDESSALEILYALARHAV